MAQNLSNAWIFDVGISLTGLTNLSQSCRWIRLAVCLSRG